MFSLAVAERIKSRIGRHLSGGAGMNLVVVILIGVGIGAMVELLLPGHHMTELILAMLLGVMGAMLAHYIGRILGWYGRTEPGAFLAAGLGAIVVLLLYGALFRRGHRGRPS